MARSAEDIIKEQLGNLIIAQAQLLAEVEKLKEELAKKDQHETK